MWKKFFFYRGDRSEDRDSENYGKSDGDRTNTTSRSLDDDSSSSDEDGDGMNPNRAQSGNKSGFTGDPEDRSGLNADSPATFEDGRNSVGENSSGGSSQNAPEKAPKKVQTLCLI